MRMREVSQCSLGTIISPLSASIMRRRDPVADTAHPQQNKPGTGSWLCVYLLNRVPRIKMINGAVYTYYYPAARSFSIRTRVQPPPPPPPTPPTHLPQVLHFKVALDLPCPPSSAASLCTLLSTLSKRAACAVFDILVGFV